MKNINTPGTRRSKGYSQGNDKGWCYRWGFGNGDSSNFSLGSDDGDGWGNGTSDGCGNLGANGSG